MDVGLGGTRVGGKTLGYPCVAVSVPCVRSGWDPAQNRDNVGSL